MIDSDGSWVPDRNTPESIARSVQNSLAREHERESAARADSVGKLEETVTLDHSGRKIITFRGDKRAWMDQFKAPGVRILKFDKSPKSPDFSRMPGGSGLTDSESRQLAMDYRDHVIAQQTGGTK
jgi:hypothetical protein